jgi:mRNA-degrading endonuclease YafQ of YafQ-DinJ toxin-antitoxin module
MDVAKKIAKAIIAGKIKNPDISSDLATLIGVDQPYPGAAPRGVVKDQMKKLKLESAEIEEAENRLIAHTPVAAKRLIKKLKNKFSGYRWDDRVKGDEIIYPNEPHIKRFIKKQPEVADMKEEVSLEEAKGVSTWYPKEFYNKNKNKYLVHFTAGREDSKVFDRSRSGLNSAYKYMENQKDYAVLIFIDKSGKPEVLEKGSKTQVAESTKLVEADNRLVAHTPAAAKRLIKKLKNKFSGYAWDGRVKGDEIIYPNEPYIKRFIKKQPEVADMKEEEELEEAFNIDKGAKVAMKMKNDKMLYGKVIKKEKVMGKPGVEVKWSNGTKGRFSNDQFAALSMDDKADFKISS